MPILNIHIYDSHTLVFIIHARGVCYGITAYDGQYYQIKTF